ncbi:SAM-dependent methyltransferase [Streptomyces sp. NPDC055036]
MRDEIGTRATTARVTDYLLSGKDHYPIDREPAERALTAAPFLGEAIEQDRNFAADTVSALRAQCGVRQVVDLGCGLPRPPYLHDRLAGYARSGCLYVDQDPVVVAHRRAITVNRTSVTTEVLQADITRPDEVIGSREHADTIRLADPVILVAGGVLHHLTDADAQTFMRAWRRAVAPGSYLIVTTWTDEFEPVAMRAVRAAFTEAGMPTLLRTRQEITELREGWDLAPPGVERPDFPLPRNYAASLAVVCHKPAPPGAARDIFSVPQVQDRSC